MIKTQHSTGGIEHAVVFDGSTGSGTTRLFRWLSYLLSQVWELRDKIRLDDSPPEPLEPVGTSRNQSHKSTSGSGFYSPEPVLRNQSTSGFKRNRELVVEVWQRMCQVRESFARLGVNVRERAGVKEKVCVRKQDLKSKYEQELLGIKANRNWGIPERSPRVHEVAKGGGKHTPRVAMCTEPVGIGDHMQNRPVWEVMGSYTSALLCANDRIFLRPIDRFTTVPRNFSSHEGKSLPSRSHDGSTALHVGQSRPGSRTFHPHDCELTTFVLCVRVPLVNRSTEAAIDIAIAGAFWFVSTAALLIVALLPVALAGPPGSRTTARVRCRQRWAAMKALPPRRLATRFTYAAGSGCGMLPLRAHR